MAVKRSGSRSTLVEITDVLTSLGLKIGLVSFVIVLAYLIYGLVGGSSLTSASGLTHADKVRIISNVVRACQILGISWFILALSMTVRYYVEESLGYLMSILGVLLYFGTPWVFSAFFSESATNSNQALTLILEEFKLLGIVVFVPGLWLIIRDILLRLSMSLAAKEKRARKQHIDTSFIVGEASAAPEKVCTPGPYAKCWQTSYCRDFVKGFCPAYEKRKSCWRIKSGCFCDENTMLRALKIKSKDSEMFEKDVLYRTAGNDRGPKLTSKQKRMLCRNCVIYQFHQQQKYKLISPLVIPATLALIWYSFSTIQSWFKSAVEFSDKFVSKVSFLPQANHVAPTTSVPDIVLWLCVAWLAILVISYLLRLVEFCIFKLQI